MRVRYPALSPLLAVPLLFGGLSMVASLQGAPRSDSPPEGVSVTIRDGVQETRAGDYLRYTATVKNGGVAGLDARLVITLPAYVKAAEVEGGATRAADTSWTVTVPAGSSVSESLTATVGTIPKGELRVTALASVYLGSATAPLVRSADADTIAGVIDPAHAVGESPPAHPGSPSPLAWVIGGVIAAIVLAAAAWALFRVRRRRREARSRPESVSG